MKDRLEKFILEHRPDFDIREPDPRLWGKIKAALGKEKAINWKLVLKRAAIVILIFSASYMANEFIHHLQNGNSKDQSIVQMTRDQKIPGLKETEAYYANLVNLKMEEIKPIIANCPSIEQELKYDISELDSIYKELKNDLKDNMANQEVIEAIIENYRLKISILEDIMGEINQQGDECIYNTDHENHEL
jgi:hypothetical protein